MAERMATLQDFTDYWQLLGDAHPSIVQVYFGDADRITDRQRSNVRYPLLLVETPDTPLVRNDSGVQLQFASFITVLDKPKSEAYHHEDISKKLTHTILVDLINWLIEDASRGAFDLTPSRLKPEYLGPWSGDLDAGWRTRVELGAVRPICPLTRHA